MTFAPFDPLESKSLRTTDAAIGALKKEIENILSSYVGWYDPFCELIQNSLDAVEERVKLEAAAGTNSLYKPKISVIVDLDENALTVSDNGIGLDQERFQQFLAPSLSFKTGKTRGHKGVGATYVAYGFNYMRVSTKTPGFEASGRIVNARSWLKSGLSGGNPKVEPDNSSFADLDFIEFDRGVSITVRFDKDTHPKRLDWIQASGADKWALILNIKTGFGSIIKDDRVQCQIVAIENKLVTKNIKQGTEYLWLHKFARKRASVREVQSAIVSTFAKYGHGRRIPDRFINLDFLYETWTVPEIVGLLGNSIDDEEQEVLDKHAPIISMEYGYTAKLWSGFNEDLGTRSGYRVLSAGIQLAANNMPQGETMQLTLSRSIGRQNQIQFLVHFDNYTPDLGRKGFHRALSDFARSICRKITEQHLFKLRVNLRPNTGVAPDLVRELGIGEWKQKIIAHEKSKPLVLESEHFFVPIRRISITSAPTREQDVIALFHQLIAGGVIRGINAMSTNERFTYDGLFRISFDLPVDLYVYDDVKNPLGVSEEVAHALAGKVTDPRILEYKFSLDGLIEDFETQDKNIKDIDLCIVWITGDMYKERYAISSLLIPENVDQRQYHGVTHVLADIETGAKHCDLIVLSELVSCLNRSKLNFEDQRAKYD